MSNTINTKTPLRFAPYGKPPTSSTSWSKSDDALMQIQERAGKYKTKIRVGNYWEDGVCKWDALVEKKDGTQNQYMAASLSILLRILSQEINE